jgi:DNA polymerase III subunit chi
MTRIDFHTNVPDKIAYVCRLVRKARVAQCKLVLLTAPSELARLDDALWTFSEQEFLPHVVAGDALAANTPVVLTASDDVELPHHQILINLTDATPRHFARFERMFEIVASDDAAAAAGRERYRFYKQRGYPLSHFVANHS